MQHQFMWECGKLMGIVDIKPHPLPEFVSTEGIVMYMSGEILLSFEANQVPKTMTQAEIAHDVLRRFIEANKDRLKFAEIDPKSTDTLRFIMKVI